MKAKRISGRALAACASGAGSYALEDAGCESVAYDGTDALRALAQAARAYRLEWEGPREEKTLEEYAAEYARKLDNMGMTFIRGQRADKGKAEVYFEVDTSDECIAEIVGEVGCELIEAGKVEFQTPGAESYKYAMVKTADGGEEAAMDAFEEYPEVIDATPTGGIMADETGEVSLSGVSSSQSGRSIDSFFQYYLRYAGFEKAWNTVRCDGAVAVGVIDSGIML